MDTRIVYYRVIGEYSGDIYQFEVPKSHLESKYDNDFETHIPDESLEYDIKDAAEHYYSYNDGWAWWDRDTVVTIEIVNEDGTEVFGKGSVTMEYIIHSFINMSNKD